RSKRSRGDEQFRVGIPMPTPLGAALLRHSGRFGLERNGDLLAQCRSYVLHLDVSGIKFLAHFLTRLQRLFASVVNVLKLGGKLGNRFVKTTNGSKICIETESQTILHERSPRFRTRP